MKRILLLLLALLALSGCTVLAAEPLPHTHSLVVAVRIESPRGESLCYNEASKVQAVLDYLQNEKLEKAEYVGRRSPRVITLFYSDGHRKTYELIDEAYLREEGGDWKAIMKLPEKPFQQILDENASDIEIPYGNP